MSVYDTGIVDCYEVSLNGSADDAKSAVAVWFQWQLQQAGGDEKEALQQFLTVQVAADGDSTDGSMSLAHLHLWLQVRGLHHALHHL